MNHEEWKRAVVEMNKEPTPISPEKEAEFLKSLYTSDRVVSLIYKKNAFLAKVEPERPDWFKALSPQEQEEYLETIKARIKAVEDNNRKEVLKFLYEDED